jgi:hypothetical protein
MNKSLIGEQVDIEINTARLQLAALGVKYPEIPFTAHEACLSARSDSHFHPAALGLALQSMIEDGSCVQNPETGIVTFPID